MCFLTRKRQTIVFLQVLGSQHGGLRRFFLEKKGNPKNLDMLAWSNLVTFWSDFDQKLPKMFRGRDVCGNFGQAWVREVWGGVYQSEVRGFY